MKSAPAPQRSVSNRLMFWVATLFSGYALGQTPASIATIGQPTAGPAVLDAAGKLYYMNAPVTPGAAQTQSGGGDCLSGGGFVPVTVQRSDAHIVKVDPSAATCLCSRGLSWSKAGAPPRMNRRQARQSR